MMKKLILGTVGIALFAIFNLSAQTVSNNQTKEMGKSLNAQSLSVGRLHNKHIYLSQFKSECLGNHKKLHKNLNMYQCDGKGKKNKNRGRR